MKLVEMGSVHLEDIEVGPRLRTVDELVAQGIAATLIGEEPIQNPIQLMKIGNRLRLGAGAHRMRAYAIKGRPAIPSHIWAPDTDNPEAELRMLEITENISRRELSPLDRAANIVELQAIHLKLYGDPRGGDRKSEKSKRQSLPFWSMGKDVAEKMGLSERTIRADIQLFNSLSDASRKAIAGSALADNRAQLVALSREKPEDQKTILNLIIKGKEDGPKTVSAAAAIHHNKVDTSTPDEKGFAKFTKLWAGASKKLKKQIALHIAKEAKG